MVLCAPAFGAETVTPEAPHQAGTNSDEVLRAYLQLQEQLHATQLAIERNRRDADEAAAANAKVLAARLQAIEQALATQRAQELEAMQNSNKAMLIVAGLFATLGFAAMIFMAYFQWRTINRLAEISAALPTTHRLGAGPVYPALGPGESTVVTSNAADQSSARLLGAIDRLERRIRELEYNAHPPSLDSGAATQHEARPANGEAGPGPTGDTAAAPAPAAHAAFLLGKGQSLLNLDKPEEALECFEEILEQDPRHGEALVKKGTALERLRRTNEALECYDRAIALDSTMTIAYLCKGGLCNRLDRFSEALECYERALQTQEKTAKTTQAETKI